MCEDKKIPVIIRQVIVPGINDTRENVLELKELLNNFTVIEKIELLPYHTIAIDKYKNLNKEYKLNNITALSLDKLKELEQYLED